ncbi:threonine dehydratase [Flexibacterium corallicola]|uniref:threonine dehydratase n=1 Tax=Flexibacterium corallicola TaxID=3037259 RepID=UPI00286F9B75|nr:threonine dehydratase [Pseudovibrio sp. M1P-2-3]
MLTLAALENARDVVGAHMAPTPLYSWPSLNAAMKCEVYVKHENYAPTGSFKVRSALVYAHHMRKHYHQKTNLIAATSGNQGLGLAFAARKYGLQVAIVVPQGTSSEVSDALQTHGAFVIEHGQSLEEAQEFAASLSEESHKFTVPAFSAELVAGTGTYALELLRARPKVDAIFVPIGLGTGICGLICARELLGLKIPIYGVVAEGADTYARSFERGALISVGSTNTFAKGIAVNAPNPEALAIIRELAEDIIRVSDSQIAEAVRTMFQTTHTLCEGAAAASLAGLSSHGNKWKGKRVVIIHCGQNIERSQISAILQGRTPTPD